MVVGSKGFRGAAVIAVLVIVLSGCSETPSIDTGTTGAIFPDSTIGPLVGAVPDRTVKALPTARLAKGLIPPTNRWFSGLVYGEPSMPVFPLPLSFQLTTSGFAFGLPTVTTSPAVITGGFAAQITADVGADSQDVTAYDEASVTISQRGGGVEIGSTRIAEGSPFVTFTASEPVEVKLATSFRSSEGGWAVEVAGTTYGLVSPGTLSASGTTLALEKGQTATWFALPNGGSMADFVAAAAHPLAGTSVRYALGGGRATTSIRYRTVDDAKTMVAAMPHQYGSLAKGESCDAGTYESIYGQLRVCAVSELSWSTAELKPSGSLDLSSLSAADKSRLVDQVNSDIVATPTQPADTYYGGKWLSRLANLFSVAKQIGADDAAATLKKRIVDALDEWMQPDGCLTRESHCFVYDGKAKGIVGLAASFGSDEFNDHHFHYGYFLYAAGVVAADDQPLATKWAPVMNLLAADLATSAKSSYFPERRVFDAYAGHSWASGTAPFGDGNNQESSSEAVSAWNGLALWAAASKQTALLTEATWMLSAEAASAQAYWTNFPLDASVYQGFDHSITSLVWGGKRDYATWFSPEPSAMLGILLLPLSPVESYLAGDPGRIETNLKDAAPDGYDVVFGDYLLMYSALQGPDAASAALKETTSLNEDRIDDGNSRTYMLAWIMSRLKG